jgi:hypothetical protein
MAARGGDGALDAIGAGGWELFESVAGVPCGASAELAVLAEEGVLDASALSPAAAVLDFKSPRLSFFRVSSIFDVEVLSLGEFSGDAVVFCESLGDVVAEGCAEDCSSGEDGIGSC